MIPSSVVIIATDKNTRGLLLRNHIPEKITLEEITDVEEMQAYYNKLKNGCDFNLHTLTVFDNKLNIMSARAVINADSD